MPDLYCAHLNPLKEIMITICFSVEHTNYYNVSYATSSKAECSTVVAKRNVVYYQLVEVIFISFFCIAYQTTKTPFSYIV